MFSSNNSSMKNWKT